MLEFSKWGVDFVGPSQGARRDFSVSMHCSHRPTGAQTASSGSGDPLLLLPDISTASALCLPFFVTKLMDSASFSLWTVSNELGHEIYPIC